MPAMTLAMTAEPESASDYDEQNSVYDGTRYCWYISCCVVCICMVGLWLLVVVVALDDGDPAEGGSATSSFSVL